jgi:arabinogalactan oligomer/maltooligosaccharide transport system permease protein
MIKFGVTDIIGFFTLGSVRGDAWLGIKGDDSIMMMLRGIFAYIVSAIFVGLHMANVKDAKITSEKIKAGKNLPGFFEASRVFFDKKFYVVALILPIVGVLIFNIIPIIFMILIAFTNYDQQHLPPGNLFTWVGMDNFVQLFSGGLSSSGSFLATFLRVLGWTLVWAFFATFTNYFLGMIVALMINKKGIKFKKVFRTMFVIAIAVPQFVTLLLMQKILDVDGILNVLLGTEIRWLADTRWNSLIPRIVIIVVNIWIGVPYTLLMCSGILMNIPADYSEAARIDGASTVQIFFKITLPYMLHVTGPHLITQFVGNINNFNVIWLLTGGGPININQYTDQAQSTDLLVTWLYRLSTDNPVRYNIASVIGIIIFVISASMSLITYNRSSAAKNEEDYQ